MEILLLLLLGAWSREELIMHAYHFDFEFGLGLGLGWVCKHNTTGSLTIVVLLYMEGQFSYLKIA